MFQVYIVLAFLGLAIGSFFNVLIWRIPRNQSVCWPPSHCTSCNHKIRFWENIPLFSYLWLKGKCSDCNQKISIIYPLIEITTSATLITLFYFSGLSLDQSWPDIVITLFKIVSILLFIPIAVIDLKHYIIPDRFTIPFLIIAFSISFLPGNITPMQSFLGIVAGGGSLFAMGLLGQYVFKKGDSMGGGDVKLMAYLGALWGAQIALMGIVFGAFLGSVAGIFLILTNKLNDDNKIPFGPFLLSGTLVAIIAGEKLLNAYLSFVGF
ncbi:prepilin peptidase [Chitinispirillales bacterium ANBcel5]|uniref:prepilin peptidase n=1 Tax=Cellulosispirillum alkaliphilum TaxID=3039283 RepID=UPI002A4E6E9D|nr:prepilin peptidase [Chitinispirillales bacterium ANBcel5]